MAVVRENLALIGNSFLRDEAWAAKQLEVMHQLDPWFSGDLETIEPETLGIGSLATLKLFLEDDSKSNGRRRTIRTGREPWIDNGSGWNQSSGDLVAQTFALELKARVGVNPFDWLNVMYLTPGLGDGGAHDVVDALEARGLARPMGLLNYQLVMEST